LLIKGINYHHDISHTSKKSDNHPSVVATHELPHIMEANGTIVVYGHEIEVETE